MNNLQSTNSNFKINNVYVDIKYNDSFTLSAMTYENDYQYDCNSNNITSVCRDKEDEEKELDKLEEQEKLEYKEIKKKRLELVRRLNPFRKK